MIHLVLSYLFILGRVQNLITQFYSTPSCSSVNLLFQMWQTVKKKQNKTTISRNNKYGTKCPRKRLWPFSMHSFTGWLLIALFFSWAQIYMLNKFFSYVFLFFLGSVYMLNKIKLGPSRKFSINSTHSITIFSQSGTHCANQLNIELKLKTNKQPNSISPFFHSYQC